MNDKNTELNLYNSHLFFSCKCGGFSFKKVVEELKADFEMVDNFIKNENVESYFEYEYKFKKRISND